MTTSLYALLVGINDYPKSTSFTDLYGAVPDIMEVHHLLGEFLPAHISYHPLLLKNHEATREAVIREMRQHLGQAKHHDTVLFMFCGHGSRQPSALEFGVHYPEGIDETLVCFNSRLEGRHDLADKELAVLLDEVVPPEGHGLVILDCCHSGSGTRGVHQPKNLRARHAPPRIAPRPLHSYLDGYYLGEVTTESEAVLPAPRHLTFSSSGRHQKSYESFSGKGLFSSALTNSLRKRGLRISYRELFRQIRREMQNIAQLQLPELDLGKNQNLDACFLNLFELPQEGKKDRIPVIRHQEQLFLEWGAAHGLDPEKHLQSEVDIFEKGALESLGRGRIEWVGIDKSQIAGVQLPKSYKIHLEGRPRKILVEPFSFSFQGPPEIMDLLQSHLRLGLDGKSPFDSSPHLPYLIVGNAKEMQLRFREDGRLMTLAKTDQPEQLDALGAAIGQIWLYDRILNLPKWAIDKQFPEIEVTYSYLTDDGWVKPNPAFFLFQSTNRIEIADEFSVRMKVSNFGSETIFLTLLFLSPAYGIYHCLSNEVPAGAREMELWGLGEALYLPEGEWHSIANFALFICKYPVSPTELLWEDLDLKGHLLPHRKQKPLPAIMGLWSVNTFRNQLVRFLPGIASNFPPDFQVWFSDSFQFSLLDPRLLVLGQEPTPLTTFLGQDPKQHLRDCLPFVTTPATRLTLLKIEFAQSHKKPTIGKISFRVDGSWKSRPAIIFALIDNHIVKIGVMTVAVCDRIDLEILLPAFENTTIYSWISVDSET